MSQEANHAKMEAAAEAASVLAIMGPIISEQISTAVNHMVSSYRGGSTPHDFLVGKVAEITAYQGILSTLEVRIRQGEMAAKKEMSSG